MKTYYESQQHQYQSKTNVRKRPLHNVILIVSLLFVLLLVLESAAFMILGIWHLVIPRLQNVLSFSTDIYQREIGFGILLVIVGIVGIFTSAFGFIAFITLRVLLLRIFSICLWLMMSFGIVVGIIGVIFASQVDGFIPQTSIQNVEQTYAQEKFMLGMNGGLALFMSVTLIIGILITRCFTDDVSAYGHDQYYTST